MKQKDPHPAGERAVEKRGLHTHHAKVDTHRWRDTMCCCCWSRATVQVGRSWYCKEHAPKE